MSLMMIYLFVLKVGGILECSQNGLELSPKLLGVK